MVRVGLEKGSLGELNRDDDGLGIEHVIVGMGGFLI